MHHNCHNKHGFKDVTERVALKTTKNTTASMIAEKVVSQQNVALCFNKAAAVSQQRTRRDRGSAADRVCSTKVVCQF